VTWSLPRSEQGERRGKATKVKIVPEELFTPGAVFVKPVGGSEGAWGRLAKSKGRMRKGF